MSDINQDYMIQVVSIGNEVLNGFVVNGNAAFIGQSLRKKGYSVTSQQGLMDEARTLKAGLQYALAHNDIVITTGGLGPTCDDITRDILAEIWNCELKLNEDIYEDLNQRYESRLISAENQATLPTKATPISNPLGTAPGLCFHENGKAMFVLQGVPREMENLLTTWVMPYIEQHFPLSQKLNRSILSFCQLSESNLNPILENIRSDYPEFSFGIYPDQGYIKLHVISCDSIAENKREKLLSTLKETLSDYLYADSDRSLSETIEALCLEKQQSICTVEGHTTGAIAQIIGTHAHFNGGLILPHEFNSIEEATKSISTSILQAYQADIVLATPYIKDEDNLILLLKQNGSDFKQFKIPKRGDRQIEIKRCVNYGLAEIFKLLSRG